MRRVCAALLLATLPTFLISSLPAQEIRSSKSNFYHDGWIDLNKNGRMDVYEDARAPIDRRVEDLLSQMSLEEKIDLLGGVDGFFIRGVPRLGLPRLKVADGPIRVRHFGPGVTVAGGIALGATWDTALA